MDETEVIISFKSSGSLIVGIKRSALLQFPDSFFAVQAKYVNWKDNKEGCFETSFDDKTLDAVAAFCNDGVWPNPHLAENVMRITGVEDGFEKQCLFLGLPDEPFEEVEDDDVVTETSEQEDDFRPHEGEEDDYYRDYCDDDD